MQEVNKLPERLRSSGFSQLPPSHLQESIWRFRRTLGLMCRASESNQEKAMLIMTNNPLPDLNIWQQKDSSLGYLCKAPSQRKKVSDQEKPFHLPPLKMSQTQPSGTKNSRSIQTPSTGKKNYRFGNDEFFKSNGEYTKRCNTRKEQIQWALPKSTYQHMLRMTSDDKQAARGSTQAPAGRRLSWAPLTLAALMDSSRAVTVPGEGSFRHGQSPRWLLNSAITNKSLG
ncbi:testis-specific gene 13 protein [Discoglossus pictus]